MSFNAGVTGFFTVMVITFICWVFYRKPLMAIPSTILGAVIAASLTSVLAGTFREMFNSADRLNDRWVLSHAIGLFIGYLVVKSIFGHKKATATPAPRAEPDDGPIYPKPGDQYEQPPISDFN